MSDETIIMSDSLEAASVTTATGWYNHFDQYVGADEGTTRWSCSTHVRCSECETATPKSSRKCEACLQKQRSAFFISYPIAICDDTLLVTLFDKDRYFFGKSILDFIADLEPTKDSEHRICKCKPGYLCLINANNWTGDLPEDGELPPEVREAALVLNETIKAERPVMWYGNAIAFDVADLRARVNTRTASTATERYGR